jgi:acetyl-CoA carboxylase carboxyl transferase subunit beta
MSWLTNFVRPRFRAFVRKPDIPENLWHQCPRCEQMIFHRELEAAQKVCRHCDFHMRAGANERIRWLFGEDDEHRPIELPKAPDDPLKFVDSKRYTERLKEARARTGRDDALLAVHGTLGGQPAVVVAFDFDFLGGSMGAAVGEGIVAAARLAVLQEAAFIVITASGGARMQEGALSLMQMARTTVAVNEVKEAGLPYIVVLTDPTTGGVTASFAMLGDIAVAEPGAVIGFAGARVIENTIREKLPPNFQRAEYLIEHGVIDMVVHRRALRDTLLRVLTLLRERRPSAEVVPLPQQQARTEPAPPAERAEQEEQHGAARPARSPAEE